MYKNIKIQFAAAVLVIATLACSLSPSAPATSAPLATEPAVVEATAPAVVPPVGGSSSACAVFDSIPAAAQYNSAPEILIDTTAKYFATFKMANGGEFKIELFADKAPITVNSFVFLTCKGFFNGLTFHRVLEGFMAQGGDPTGSGMGGPGYEFVNEYSDLTFDKPGILAMANAGPDTNGSQFFITFGPAEWLNGGYTIFGQVVNGMDVVNSLTLRDPQQNPSFIGDAMESVTISQE
ncbi:MAG TPA: peptidylprolyl isomerase [Anaerolineales bacterium]|nr:peptidylprolyl isomerase [Anaerolineales bacterium]